MLSEVTRFLTSQLVQRLTSTISFCAWDGFADSICVQVKMNQLITFSKHHFEGMDSFPGIVHAAY